MSATKAVFLTDFERDVTISLLNAALSAWEGDTARQNAASRTIEKLLAVDRPAVTRDKGEQP